MQYNVHEAKTHFSKLLDRGGEIIISRQGRPIVRLELEELPMAVFSRAHKMSIPDHAGVTIGVTMGVT